MSSAAAVETRWSRLDGLQYGKEDFITCYGIDAEDEWNLACLIENEEEIKSVRKASSALVAAAAGGMASTKRAAEVQLAKAQDDLKKILDDKMTDVKLGIAKTLKMVPNIRLLSRADSKGLEQILNSKGLEQILTPPPAPAAVESEEEEDEEDEEEEEDKEEETSNLPLFRQDKDYMKQFFKHLRNRTADTQAMFAKDLQYLLALKTCPDLVVAKVTPAAKNEAINSFLGSKKPKPTMRQKRKWSVILSQIFKDAWDIDKKTKKAKPKCLYCGSAATENDHYQSAVIKGKKKMNTYLETFHNLVASCKSCHRAGKDDFCWRVEDAGHYKMEIMKWWDWNSREVSEIKFNEAFCKDNPTKKHKNQMIDFTMKVLNFGANHTSPLLRIFLKNSTYLGGKAGDQKVAVKGIVAQKTVASGTVGYKNFWPKISINKSRKEDGEDIPGFLNTQYKALRSIWEEQHAQSQLETKLEISFEDHMKNQFKAYWIYLPKYPVPKGHPQKRMANSKLKKEYRERLWVFNEFFNKKCEKMEVAQRDTLQKYIDQSIRRGYNEFYRGTVDIIDKLNKKAGETLYEKSQVAAARLAIRKLDLQQLRDTSNELLLETLKGRKLDLQQHANMLRDTSDELLVETLKGRDTFDCDNPGCEFQGYWYAVVEHEKTCVFGPRAGGAAGGEDSGESTTDEDSGRMEEEAEDTPKKLQALMEHMRKLCN
jgi:ribosomal protein L12E/L44/L45/RPP1/RPP2